MKTSSVLSLLTGILTLTLFGLAHEARAVLGGSVDSIEGDRGQLAAVRQSPSARGAYTVHELKSDATSVREYVTPTGQVFGIAWTGITHPDLTQLLGSYAGDYQSAAKAARPALRRQGRGHSTVQGSRVTVAKWGHMRNLQGRAYDASLIPAGVSVDEIQ